jgi:hypothetical protein
MRKRGNKAQMQISFGMIFSIILIIFFIAFAFFGIKKFLGVNDEIASKKIVSDLNSDIEKMWKSSKGSREVSYSVPRGVDAVCFGEKYDEYENKTYNLFFLPEEKFDMGNIEHLDLEKTLNGEERLCFDVDNRKVSFVIDKDYGETLITISREGRGLNFPAGSVPEENGW